MNTIFTTDDPTEHVDKINLDELFEKKKLHDLATTQNYNTILNRVHNKIKLTSRQQIAEHYCWFVIPEVMIGIPKYDIGTCIAYVIDKLQTNGFKVRYTHPNMLFISWQHWVPAYVRAEIKKKTGMVIDGYGNIKTEETDADKKELNPNTLLKNKIIGSSLTTNTTSANTAKSIDAYKPTGQLIYNSDIINSLKQNK
jgi:hypothetical protein